MFREKLILGIFVRSSTCPKKKLTLKSIMKYDKILFRNGTRASKCPKKEKINSELPVCITGKAAGRLSLPWARFEAGFLVYILRLLIMTSLRHSGCTCWSPKGCFLAMWAFRMPRPCPPLTGVTAHRFFLFFFLFYVRYRGCCSACICFCDPVLVQSCFPMPHISVLCRELLQVTQMPGDDRLKPCREMIDWNRAHNKLFWKK